jgi:hypothetical protein
MLLVTRPLYLSRKFWNLDHGFWRWWPPLEFASYGGIHLVHEVMVHGLRKILQIVSFLHLCSLTYWLNLQSQIVTSQNVVLLFLNYFWLTILPEEDLVLLAILSECLLPYDLFQVHCGYYCPMTCFRCLQWMDQLPPRVPKLCDPTNSSGPSGSPECGDSWVCNDVT